MVTINAKSREGEEQSLSAEPGVTLMETLRDAGIVDAVCGGVASCGTCHVYLAEDWAGKVADKTEDEVYMLESLEDVVEVRATSRLACQIPITDEHDGMQLEAAPEA